MFLLFFCTFTACLWHEIWRGNAGPVTCLASGGSTAFLSASFCHRWSNPIFIIQVTTVRQCHRLCLLGSGVISPSAIPTTSALAPQTVIPISPRTSLTPLVCTTFPPLVKRVSDSSRYIPVPSYTSWNSAGVLAAAEANVPVVMTEFNTCSCGGSPTISPTVNTLSSMLFLPRFTHQSTAIVCRNSLGCGRRLVVRCYQPNRSLPPHPRKWCHIQPIRPPILR